MKNFSNKWKFLFFIIVTNLFSILLSAQQNSDSSEVFNLSIEELLTVKINIASNVLSEEENQPVSISTINHVQLLLSGGRTLAEAIMMYVPGFFIVEDQDDVIFGFRGLAPDNNSKVMLLINGQNMNTEWFWGPSSAILNSSNFDYIEKVEVIRGPGSVVLGQGALLGVINIVTKPNYERQGKNSFSHQLGMDNFQKTSGEAFINNKGLRSYFYLSSSKYNGQALRNEGWAKDKLNEGYLEGNVFDIGTRLKRNQNTTFFNSYEYHNFNVGLLIADQSKDLYNFYRDRNQSLQTLTSATISHKYKVSNNISIMSSMNGTIDNFGLKSVDGYTMGGTRENRFGLKLIASINNLIPNNKLALGTEYHKYYFGRDNFDGNNFINNVIDTNVVSHYSQYLSDANTEKIWGYKADLDVISFFLEDYIKLGAHLNFFAAFRYDNHSYWGTKISPRFGFISPISEKTTLRFSFQTGFRGAVGVHYGGGYRKDGFLSEENFNQVVDAHIPIYDSEGNLTGEEENNIKPVEPEIMKSFEFSVDHKISKDLNFQSVLFYNIIENVIDAGVLWRDQNIYTFPDIGSDVPGDWNGYWYFKNTEGSIKQYGLEANLSYHSSMFLINMNHSLVVLQSASEQQNASMYLSSSGRFKAYPENVSRFNIVALLSEQLSVGLTYLYYYSWNSPTDQKVNGNHIVNLSTEFKLSDHLSGNFSVINLLGQKELYPMNSNAGGADLSDGTPALEKTSIWAGLKYSF